VKGEEERNVSNTNIYTKWHYYACVTIARICVFIQHRIKYKILITRFLTYISQHATNSYAEHKRLMHFSEKKSEQTFLRTMHFYTDCH